MFNYDFNLERSSIGYFNEYWNVFDKLSTLMYVFIYFIFTHLLLLKILPFYAYVKNNMHWYWFVRSNKLKTKI
jgi:hypothetical protein